MICVKMIFKRIPLDENDENVFLDIYVADEMPGLVRNAVLVIPGGGYQDIHLPEGEPVAMAFMPYGYNAFVLHYSVAPFGGNGVFPKQLIQASKAIKYIKDHAKEYNIDPEKVFTVGFSAGGHLAGSLAVMWNKAEVYDAINMEYGYNKPKGVMMVYPVVTGVKKDIWQIHSIQNLLGADWENEERQKEVSLELHVTQEACPIFLALCANDVVVKAQNSLLLAHAYAEQNLSYEMHIYPDSKHGFCLGNKVTRCNDEKWEDVSIAKWVENAVYWAEHI